MFLDSLDPLQQQVGYGTVGWRGSLGYEGKQVTVRGKRFSHAISTHPTARLLFTLGGKFASFKCQVALNDDVAAGVSHADFFVLVEGREVASATYVTSGAPPQQLVANIGGAQILELVVRTSRWECCHAVWLDPVIEEIPLEALPIPRSIVDCLGRAELLPPPSLPSAERCIATVVSPGFEAMADDMLGSFFAYSHCQDALPVIFAINSNSQCERLANRYRAVLVPCRQRARVNPMSKALLYSAARVIDSRQFLCLDADMLVVSDLRPVFAALEACPAGSILACREGNGHGYLSLRQALETVYGGATQDLKTLGITPEEAAYPLVVNDGLFAATRSAMLALDGAVRGIQNAPVWTDGNSSVWWRNQFVFNLALARLRCGVELDASYNIQLHAQNVQLRDDGARISATWQGREVRVLHFSGGAKRKHPEIQGIHAKVPAPINGSSLGDAYSEFLKALRTWLGRRGNAGLAWSFYGTADAKSGHVSDPSVLPLFAALHYLIRSNGCARVFETGTARGLSAGCLASAVAHRSNAAVVTFDPYPHDGRHEFWAALPERFRRCIDARMVGSIEGMTAAFKAGEQYEAALLDSIHTEEQVWAEFQLAAKLVCPGGLILIHDARYCLGTVPAALARIREAGYGVVRLWCAQNGAVEDDQLGLAVIENLEQECHRRNGFKPQ